MFIVNKYTYLNLLDRVATDVDPTLTVVVPAVETKHKDVLLIEVINDDVDQTVDLQLEASTSLAGPWYVFTDDQLKDIAAGDSRIAFFPLRYKNIRVTGTASGVGASCRVTADLLSERK